MVIIYRVHNIKSKFCSVMILLYLLSVMVLSIQGEEADIKFPDGTMAKPRCKGNRTDVYCNVVDNYPAAHLEKLIEADSKRFTELFGEDLLLVDFASKFDRPGEESLCRHVEQLIFPQEAINHEDQWKVIINFGNYKQGIRIERCLGAGENCMMTESFPNYYKTECRQIYVYRPLLTLDKLGDDAKIVKEQFRFPGGCKCILKKPELP